MRFQELDLENIHPKQHVPHPCYQCTEKTETCRKTCKWPGVYAQVKRKQYDGRAELFRQTESDMQMRKRIAKLSEKRKRR